MQTVFRPEILTTVVNDAFMSGKYRNGMRFVVHIASIFSVLNFMEYLQPSVHEKLWRCGLYMANNDSIGQTLFQE